MPHRVGLPVEVERLVQLRAVQAVKARDEVLYRGLGAVVLGGLVVSTFFTLFLVPAVFILMLDFNESLRRAIGWSREEDTSVPQELPTIDIPEPETAPTV